MYKDLTSTCINTLHHLCLRVSHSPKRIEGSTNANHVKPDHQALVEASSLGAPSQSAFPFRDLGIVAFGMVARLTQLPMHMPGWPGRVTLRLKGKMAQ